MGNLLTLRFPPTAERSITFRMPYIEPIRLEAISKMSFGPISLLVPRFKSSKYGSIPPV